MVEQNDFTNFLKDYANTLPAKPRAVLCISAHWVTGGTYITAVERPETIHDFYGFPDELYRVQYPAPGDAELARELAGELELALDMDRGLDHGCYSPLLYIFPEADVPVLQLSLNQNFSLADFYTLGQKIGALPEQGIFILGSGNAVHNLGTIGPHELEPPDWAVRFDENIQRALEAKDAHYLTENLGDPLLRMAHPSLDHYVPLLVCAGAGKDLKAQTIFMGWQNTSISMRCVAFA